MRLGPSLGLLLQPVDEFIELLAVDAPRPAATKLDRGELARSHKGISLRDARAQIGRNVFEPEISGFNPRTSISVGLFECHLPSMASAGGAVSKPPFAFVCHVLRRKALDKDGPWTSTSLR